MENYINFKIQKITVRLPQHTHTTCQRQEHFPQALPAQLSALRASIIVKTWKEKLPCLDVMEESTKKAVTGYGKAVNASSCFLLVYKGQNSIHI